MDASCGSCRFRIFGQLVALCFWPVHYPQVFTCVAVFSAWSTSHEFPLSGTCPLAGPHLLGGRGHKERSGSALALSLPWDRDNEVVSSRTLGACIFSWCLLRFWARQIFRTLVRVGCFVGGGKLYCFFCPPALLGRCFLAPGFTGETLPPSRLHMRSLQWRLLTLWSPESDHPSLPVPLSQAVREIFLCGYCGTVFVTGFFNSGLQLRFCTDVRTRLCQLEATASSFVLVSVVY